MKMANTFDWIEIRTHNIEKSATFYESLFGWKTTKKEMAAGSDVWIFDTGGEPRLENLRRGGIWLRPNDEPLGMVVYVVVDDMKQALKRVTELGGEITTPKFPVGAGYAAFFKDPEGNLIGLYQDIK